ncbi:MAG: rRNA adenine dimethyltransferase family protein [Phycisphaeraceae bacterium]
MAQQTLSEIKALLAAFGLHPRHRFGQNFLHDAGKMQHILAAAELSPGEVVLEVGPGTGALSVRLLEAGIRLVAVEIDRDLEPILRDQLCTPQQSPPTPVGGTCDLIIDDVLAGKHEINPRVWQALRIVGELREGASGAETATFKLVANLPYNIASPLIANLLLAPYEALSRQLPATSPNPEPGTQDPEPSRPRLSLAVVMIQREVADRLTAPPGGKDYGPLGVLVQAMCEVDRVTILSPGCFWPQPKVDSAVVRLRVRPQPMTSDPPKFSAFLHRVFSKRRKQLGSILGRATPLPADIDPQSRPEQLSVEQLIRLSDSIV